MEEQLIIAVQGFPELYDLSSPHYFDSNKRNNAESTADGLLSNDRRLPSATARALWKKGESSAPSVFHAFLGAICEQPLTKVN